MRDGVRMDRFDLRIEDGSIYVDMSGRRRGTLDNVKYAVDPDASA